MKKNSNFNPISIEGGTFFLFFLFLSSYPMPYDTVTWQRGVTKLQHLAPPALLWLFFLNKPLTKVKCLKGWVFPCSV